MTSSSKTQSKGSMLHQFSRIGMGQDRIWSVPHPIRPRNRQGSTLGIDDAQDGPIPLAAIAAFPTPKQGMAAQSWPEGFKLQLQPRLTLPVVFLESERQIKA